MSNKLKATKEKVFAFAALSLATLAVAACGEQQSSGDKGSSKIGECEKGYTAGAKPIKGSREQFRVDLGNAVVSMSSKLQLNRAGNPATSFSNQDSSTTALVNAGAGVLHIDSRNTVDVFEVDTPENKVDDLSEQFCSTGPNLYVAPATATAIGAMKAVGVDTTSLEAYTK